MSFLGSRALKVAVAQKLWRRRNAGRSRKEPAIPCNSYKIRLQLRSSSCQLVGEASGGRQPPDVTPYQGADAPRSPLRSYGELSRLTSSESATPRPAARAL